MDEYIDELLANFDTKKELDLFEDAPLPVKLDPEIYYTLVVENVPVIYPDGSYVKKGYTIVRKEIDEDLGGSQFELLPVARGPDITDDGKVYWVSFEPEKLRVTKALAEEVLELVDPDQRYKLFTVIGKAVKEPLAPVTEEEESDHYLTKNKVDRGDEITWGALHGIDIRK